MVRVPVPLVSDAEASGRVTLFCCPLAPRLDAKRMEAVGRAGARPWPERLKARPSTVSMPWYGAPDCGVNAIWKDADCPGSIETGVFRPAGPLKSLPETETVETVMLELAGFESKTVSEWVSPTVTFPKSMSAPFTARNALKEPVVAGLKSTSTSASEAGPT